MPFLNRFLRWINVLGVGEEGGGVVLQVQSKVHERAHVLYMVHHIHLKFGMARGLNSHKFEG